MKWLLCLLGIAAAFSIDAREVLRYDFVTPSHRDPLHDDLLMVAVRWRYSPYEKAWALRPNGRWEKVVVLFIGQDFDGRVYYHLNGDGFAMPCTAYPENLRPR